MDKKGKLKELLRRLNALPDLAGGDIDSLTERAIKAELPSLTEKIRENATIRSLEGISTKLKKFEADFNLKPLLASIQEMQDEMQSNSESMSTDFSGKLDSLRGEINQAMKQGLDTVRGESESSSDRKVKDLIKKLSSLEDDSGSQKSLFRATKAELEASFGVKLAGLEQALRDASLVSNGKTEASEAKVSAQVEAKVAELSALIEKTRRELVSRIGSMGGGGNANRNISIGGNSSVLSRYTDINLKAGANVTLTYANNNTTKNVDVTVAASSSGGGISRSINSVAVDTAAGASASTDYVYLVSSTTTITLPTAVGNSNLYTIKNVGVGTVTVATTSAQTIDGSTTITMPVQYTSVDIASDTANWNVT